MGRRTTDNTRSRDVLEDIRKGKRTISAGSCEDVARFPEFSPSTLTRRVSKTLKHTPVFSGCIRPIKHKGGRTHMSAISCERQKSWERGRGSGRREKQKAHTGTPGVWGEMRTRGPNSHSQQQRRSDTGKCGGRMGGLGGVKVTALRLQLCYNIREGSGFIQRDSVGGSVQHLCSQTDSYTMTVCSCKFTSQSRLYTS